MLQLVTLVILTLIVFIYYKYSYRPRLLLKKYEKMLKSLGYKVYVQQFQTFGFSFININNKSIKEHNDAQYQERTIYPSVDIVLGNVFDKLLVIFVNPDLLKEFLSIQKVGIYPKQKTFIRGLTTISGDGLIFSEGQLWKNKRKIMSKVFNFALLKANIPKIAQICDKSFDDFDRQYSFDQNKCKYNLSKLGVIIFSEIMMKCFLGCGLQGTINNVNISQFTLELTSEAGELSMKPYFLLFGKIVYKFGLTKQARDVKRKANLIRGKITEIIQERTKKLENYPMSEVCTDLVQALIQERLNSKSQFTYSTKDIINQFSTSLIVGTDTTTHMFRMMVYYLGKLPRIQEKVRKQINQIIKTNSNDEIIFDNLKKLTYIDLVQLETIRHYGPANGNFFREAMEDNLVLNVPISKGTIVGIQPKGNHYNPKYFKDPQQFRPERWESQCDNLNPYVLIGFSAGPRSCIGKQLAFLESKIAIVKLIKRYDTIQVPENLTFVYKLLYEPLGYDAVFTKTKKVNDH